MHSSTPCAILILMGKQKGIAAIAVGLILLLAFIIFTSLRGNTPPTSGVNPIYTVPNSSPVGTYTGTIKRGSDITEKTYCSNGYYLVADAGTYIKDQAMMILLKNPGDEPQSMYDGVEFVGKKVRMTAMESNRQAFCEALICSCDDYLLVDTVTPL